METRAAIILSVVAFTFASAAEIISRSVGQVAEYVVTSREVQISNLIEQALNLGEEKFFHGARLLKLSEPAFKEELNSVFLEIVVDREARAFAATSIEPEEMSNAFANLFSSVKKTGTYDLLKPSAVELKSILHRKLRAKNFIRFKAESSIVPVTDSEALNYFNRNRAKFGSQPFAAFNDRIKSFLTKQRVDERLEVWFTALQKKYRVRLIARDNE